MEESDYMEGFSVADFVSDYGSRTITESDFLEVEEDFIRREIKDIPDHVASKVSSEEALKVMNV